MMKMRMWRVDCMFFFFKQKTAYEVRISDWSSDVCSSDLIAIRRREVEVEVDRRAGRFRRLRGVAVGHVGSSLGAVAAASPGQRGAVVGAEQIGRASWRARVCRYV